MNNFTRWAGLFIIWKGSSDRRLTSNRLMSVVIEKNSASKAGVVWISPALIFGEIVKNAPLAANPSRAILTTIKAK
jgi:hypothetical protein